MQQMQETFESKLRKIKEKNKKRFNAVLEQHLEEKEKQEQAFRKELELIKEILPKV